MNPRKYWDDARTPPPDSQPASRVSEAAALHSPPPGRSKYLPITLSSVCRRRRPGFPNVSLPRYWLQTTEKDPPGRHRIWPPVPGASLKRPYDCQPFTSHGSTFRCSVGKICTRAPLKNHGVFEDTYEGWYVQLSAL